MIFDGWMLIAASPGQRPEWTRGSWAIEDGRVARLGRPGRADVRGYAVPGMVDCHCHIGITDGGGSVGEAVQREQAAATLASGVTLVRDCGCPVDNSWLARQGSGPSLDFIHCGRHVARPMRYIRGLAVEVEDERDLPRVLADQASRSDGWVKLVGDWIDRSKGADSDLDPLWSLPVLRDAVAAAHEAGARVAVHAFSHSAIDDLIEAGVDDIEHGSGIDADQADEIARRSVLVAPTLAQVALFDSFADQAGAKYPVYAATMRAMHEERREHFAMLADSGVRLVSGVDSGGYQKHGSIVNELALWQEAGMDPARVVDTATWGTRAALGRPALTEGGAADLVVLATEWRQFVDLDPAKIGPLVRTRTIVDGRNALDREAWSAAGWKHVGIGR